MPPQKIRSLFLPNPLKRYAVITTVSMTLGIGLYGCGESKISQCNKVVTVANKTKALTIPKDISGFVPLAENIDQIRTEIQAIPVQDAKLKELQLQLLSMYGDASQSLKTQAKATEAKDNDALTKAKQDLAAAATKENEIADRLNELCAR